MEDYYIEIREHCVEQRLHIKTNKIIKMIMEDELQAHGMITFILRYQEMIIQVRSECPLACLRLGHYKISTYTKLNTLTSFKKTTYTQL